MNKLRFNEQCIVDTKWASYQIIQDVPEFSFFLHLVISFYSIYFTVRLFHTDQPIFNFTVCLLFRLLCIDQPTYASAKNLFVWIDDAPAIDSTLNISNKQIKNLEIKPKIEKSYRVFNHTKYNSLVLPYLYYIILSWKKRQYIGLGHTVMHSQLNSIHSIHKLYIRCRRS